MSYKLITATIFLSGDVAVKSIANRDVLQEKPSELAVKYDDFGVDQLYIIDLSKNYIEHECAHIIIEDIVKKVNIPVIVAGCIRNKGDISRLLDNGVSQVCLNFSKENNIELAKTIKDEFEQDRLLTAIVSADNIYDNRELINSISSGIVLMKDSELSAVLRASDLPVLCPCGDISLEAVIKLLSEPMLSGIFGNFVSANLKSLNQVKQILLDSGIETLAFNPQMEWKDLKLNESGLIPVIVQDYKNNDVLMMAYMNQEAFENTIKTGRMNYYSRSRKSQWIKGETSGHFQYVKSLNADCDSDTLLAKVSQVGAACHTGSRSCFFKEIIKREVL